MDEKFPKDGEGMYRYPNGDVFYGEWIDRKPVKEGKMVYANGNIYTGRWKDGKRHGQGKMRYSNGEIFRGEWKNDTPLTTKIIGSEDYELKYLAHEEFCQYLDSEGSNPKVAKYIRRKLVKWGLIGKYKVTTKELCQLWNSQQLFVNRNSTKKCGEDKIGLINEAGNIRCKSFENWTDEKEKMSPLDILKASTASRSGSSSPCYVNSDRKGKCIANSDCIFREEMTFIETMKTMAGLLKRTKGGTGEEGECMYSPQFIEKVRKSCDKKWNKTEKEHACLLAEELMYHLQYRLMILPLQNDRADVVDLRHVEFSMRNILEDYRQDLSLLDQKSLCQQIESLNQSLEMKGDTLDRFKNWVITAVRSIPIEKIKERSVKIFSSFSKELSRIVESQFDIVIKNPKLPVIGWRVEEALYTVTQDTFDALVFEFVGKNVPKSIRIFFNEILNLWLWITSLFDLSHLWAHFITAMWVVMQPLIQAELMTIPPGEDPKIQIKKWVRMITISLLPVSGIINITRYVTPIVHELIVSRFDEQYVQYISESAVRSIITKITTGAWIFLSSRVGRRDRM